MKSLKDLRFLRLVELLLFLCAAHSRKQGLCGLTMNADVSHFVIF